MKRLTTTICTAALFVVAGSASAVPQFINYQGRVVVDGTNYTGTGEFRFTLLDDSNNVVWSNDGVSPIPSNSVSLQVTKGLFSVGLGDDSLPNMTAIPTSIVTNDTPLKLRLWFSDGGGFEQLSPDISFGSVLHAYEAQSAQDASTLDGNSASAFATSGHDHDAEYVMLSGDTITGDLVIEGSLGFGNTAMFSAGINSNETVSAATPIGIPDNSPVGIADTIILPDVGNVDTLIVDIDVSNSDISGIVVELTDPSNTVHTLFNGGSAGVSLVRSYPTPDAQVSGDLTTWLGTNPMGNWTLRVIDSLFLNNGIDGAINDWGIRTTAEDSSLVTLSMGDLEIGGKLNVDGDLDVNDGLLFADVSENEVGIGTSDAEHLLHVVGTDPFPGDEDDAQLAVEGTDATGSTGTGASIALVGRNTDGRRTWGTIRGLKENSTGNDSDSYMRFTTRNNTTGIEERMRIDSEGNVGIGLTDPDEPLDVAGDIETTGDFMYSAPRTNYLSISVYAFLPEDPDSDLYETSTGTGYLTPNIGNVDFGAQVDLPNGAVVKSVTAYYYDNSAGFNITVDLNLKRRALTSTGASNMAIINATTAGSSGSIQSTTDSTIFAPTVDNQTYLYYLDLRLSPGFAPVDALRFYGAQIAYTATSPNY